MTYRKFNSNIQRKEWKNKLETWAIIYDTVQKEQVINYHQLSIIIVLLQSLLENKKAEKTVSALTTVEHHTDNGMKLLIEKLDNTFQSEVIEDAYSMYQKFNKLNKQTNMSKN